MAKAEKPKKDNARGRTKAANRKGTRIEANKQRAAETRQRRLQAAARRKRSLDYIVPLNATVTLADLPKKARDKFTEFPNDVDDHGHPIVVPDPMRGMKARGKRCGDAVTRRIEQARKISAKRDQRRAFAKLSPKEKYAHREAGRAHKTLA